MPAGKGGGEIEVQFQPGSKPRQATWQRDAERLTIRAEGEAGRQSEFLQPDPPLEAGGTR
ncbi:MAG: hypothetical protein B7Z53_01755 [Rhodospirillales bacterium 12-71-4]|nr:MAG: hypothetical protein B7Z53_01755 [Rhodospirillales bacterium 12-71-4]